MAILQLSSSFHGTSLLFNSRSQAHAQLNIPSSHVTCSSHWKRRHAGSPISKPHLSSLLTSSLHNMQTPQGEALLAIANQRLPPVLISQAASQQLELLAAAAAAESTRPKDVLQRRIAGIKEKEITKALQDITLALVTHRLLQALPNQTPRQQDDAVHQLLVIHPPLMQPLIGRHVALVVNGKDRAHLPFEPHVLARVCTFEMGKMYAASIMHGYFLARVYQRFKLERALQLEAVSMDPPKQRDGFGLNRPHEQLQSEEVSMEAYLQSESFKDTEPFHHPHTLDVIERHCQVLFGAHTKPLHTSSILNIQLGSMKGLTLQALAFGALLWDVENNFIPCFYPLL